jgi:Tfp pilus assembly major pilin PilA
LKEEETTVAIMRPSRSVSFSEETSINPDAIRSPQTSVPRGLRVDTSTSVRNPSPLLQFQTRHLTASSPLAIRPSTPNNGNRSRSNSVSSAYSYQDLARRPRSNPRNRTPMRQESPVVSTTIRIGAGSTRGTIVTPSMTSAAIHHTRFSLSQEEESKQKSSKQGPSHRKIRRWNNDRHVGIASEITNPKFKEASIRNEAMEAVMLELPIEYRNSFTKLSTKQKEQFLNNPSVLSTSKSSKKETSDKTTSNQMWNRIHPRLKTFLLRACKTTANKNLISAFECILIHYISQYLMPSHEHYSEQLKVKNEFSFQESQEILSQILMQPPLITTVNDHHEKVYVRFLFEKSQKGAYHRMFLHSVCQFHGWNATSTKGTSRDQRLLTVSVKKGINGIAESLLVDYLSNQFRNEQNTLQKCESMEMPNISTLRVS